MSTITISKGTVSIEMCMADHKIKTASLNGVQIVINGKIVNNISPEIMAKLFLFFTGYVFGYSLSFTLPEDSVQNTLSSFTIFVRKDKDCDCRSDAT